MATYSLDPDITGAHTLPGSFYHDQVAFDQSKYLVFARNWQVVEIKEDTPADSNVFPFILLEGFLDEPLLLVKFDSNEDLCLSNVCTHRGNILMSGHGKQKNLTCGYHGRCFDLKGRMLSMPGFKAARNFPSEGDHLPAYELAFLGPLRFIRLLASHSPDKIFSPLLERMNWFPFYELELEQSLCHDYQIDAHWALYCENYLEGFHIPFVHEKLNSKLDFAAYEMTLYKMCNVQIGIAGKGEDSFRIPAGHQDHGKSIYAYYWWLFPNIMVNLYTWGLSLNIVKPLAVNRTEISFKTYLLPGADREKVRLTGVHETEMEDEEIVRSVQRGVSSLSYDRGRFSPSMEQGVHHFQSLLVDHLNQVL